MISKTVMCCCVTCLNFLNHSLDFEFYALLNLTNIQYPIYSVLVKHEYFNANTGHFPKTSDSILYPFYPLNILSCQMYVKTFARNSPSFSLCLQEHGIRKTLLKAETMICQKYGYLLLLSITVMKPHKGGFLQTTLFY